MHAGLGNFAGWGKIATFGPMKFDYWFSSRLRLRRGASSSTDTGVIIAVVGVALALAVMELSLAVATGFKGEIRRKVLGFSAPVAVAAPYDPTTAHTEASFAPSDTLLRVVADFIPEGTRAVESARLQAIVKTDSDFAAVEMVGYGPGHDYTFERSVFTRGTLPAFAEGAPRDSIVISQHLASALRLDTAERPFLYFFIDGEVKARRATVAGIYKSNFGDYDAAIAFAPLPMLRSLCGGRVSAIDIEGVPESRIDTLSHSLQMELVSQYRAGHLPTLHPVTDVHQTGALYFNWLDLLDTNVVVIFILMLCVAALTLISSLFIIILDRVSTIGVLRALGAKRSEVSAIFVHVAMRIVGLGMLIGNVLGLGLALMQRATHALPLDPEMYYLAYVPVQINWWAMLALNAGVAAAAWLILILPARLAARIDPASTMRYE